MLKKSKFDTPENILSVKSDIGIRYSFRVNLLADYNHYSKATYSHKKDFSKTPKLAKLFQEHANGNRSRISEVLRNFWG